MKKFITVFLCMAVLFASGFGGVGTVSAAEQITQLVLSQNKVSIEKGDSVTLTATAVYDSGRTVDVTTKTSWDNQNSPVASAYLGKITGEQVGTAKIIANYQGQSASVEVEVLKKVKSIVKSKQSLDIRSGDQGAQQVTLDAYFEDGSSKEDVTNKATWTSDNELIATVINGKVVGHSSGSAVITAKYGKHSTTIPVNVDTIKRLEPSKTNFSFLLEDKNQVSEVINLWATYPNSEQPEDVAAKAEWSSDNEAVADYINGKIVAYSAGKATLTAKFGTKTATIKVEVDASMKLELDKQSLFMKTTDKTPQKLVLTAYYATEGTQTDPKIQIKTEDVTEKAEWSSSDPSVASVTKGYVSALKTGEAVITAKYGDKSVSITVDVEVPRRIEADSDYVSISTKDKTNGSNKKQLAVFAHYANGTSDNVTSKAEWTSSNDSVASISKDGIVTANKAGETTITAKYAGKTVTIQVDVDIPRKLTFGVSSLELQVGGVSELQLKAIYGDEANGEDVTSLAEWSTSSATVAEVRKGKITGVSTGTATVTAKYGNRTVTIPVSVGIVKGLTITKVNTGGTEEKVEKLVMKKGDSVKLKLSVNYTAEAGKSEDVTKLAVWSPAESKVAQVDSDGQVKAIGSGKVDISAKFGDKTVKIPVEVDVTDSLTASERTVFMSVEDQVDIKLNPGDSNSDYVTNQAEWSSSSPSVADVTNGRIKAYKNGRTTITAKYGGKSVSIQVEVDIIEKLEANTRFVQLKTLVKEDSQFQVELTAYLSGGRKVDVTKKAEWKVSSYKVADVSKGNITAVGYGKTSVTAKYGGKSIYIPVEVDQLKYLKTNEVKLEMKPGQEDSIIAKATYLDGKEVDVSVPALWSTSKLQVADVKDGKIKAYGPGRATITVKYAGKSTQVVVNVSK